MQKLTKHPASLWTKNSILLIKREKRREIIQFHLQKQKNGRPTLSLYLTYKSGLRIEEVIPTAAFPTQWLVKWVSVPLWRWVKISHWQSRGCIQPIGAAGHTRHLHRHTWVAFVAFVMAAGWGGSEPGFVFEKYTLIKPSKQANRTLETNSLEI